MNRLEAIYKNKYEKAYFTVEAALIMPMVIFITIIMIFLAFYSYDRCVLEHSAYQAALKGTDSHLKTSEEIYDIVSKSASRLVDKRLFAIRDFAYDVHVEQTQVTVRYHCRVNMPMYDNGMTLNVGRSATRYKTVRIIREFRILKSKFTE